ncbi:DMP19 family protein [Aurantiacibacter zhengii]|uniref:DNA mimic protein DMP19 C-terminal domain-containing protein n=1 Tax=Aurantiacibacter zhengii TaxID=2307003 RepID=A0A418NV64_9SPHN|nr:hypothetical protein [Aurantiacibacter zhengii]RIV87953.1 hypothetical protein D2V07_06495 [Aurantiacibacter zhengii]
MYFWDHPKAATNVAIDSVIVRAGHAGADDPELLCMDIADFTFAMMQSGRYPMASIPQPALMGAAFKIYVGEVYNGGHAQFIGNSEWGADDVGLVSACLKHVEIPQVERIYADLLAYERTSPKTFHKADWRDQVLDALDKRLFALDRESIFAPLERWLKDSLTLFPVPAENWHSVVYELAARNRDPQGHKGH